MGDTVFKVSKGYIFFFQTPDIASRLRVFFPGMKQMPTEDGMILCAIPHTLDAVRLLTNVGKKVDSPILYDYDWPGICSPYDHQRDTSNFLTIHKRAFCLNGMGTGKTKATLWADDFCKEHDGFQSTLITCPLSTLDVWSTEIFKTLPHRRYQVVYGSSAKRRELLSKKADYYIVNHDGVDIIANELKKRPDINHFIIDEVATYRNRSTRKWKVMNELINQGHPRSVWGLTGTPTPNEPTDAYGQMRLIKPSNFKGSFTDFKDATMYQVSQYRWYPRTGCQHEVNRILKPSIRYALEDCISLPPTIYSDRKCELTPSQKVHFDRLRKEAYTIVNESQVSAVNAGVLLNKLVQAACGVLYGSTGEVIELDFGFRLKLLNELLYQCNEKVIVFVPLTGVLDAIHDKLSKEWDVEVVDGRTSKTKRLDLFRRFQFDKSPHVLIANAETMAHGLTLTAASTIIWYAPISKNEIYNQANARIVRPGQANVTNIIRMYATATEQRMYQSLEDRSDFQDIVLDLAKGA